ncbi:helical backbone metal receptor [Methanoculleus chikugoensis]|uniref:ABC transporter substrate-binding protein n=1 Tax=Methanoculleus chikugoensis TaxID=118126 RepID=UPI0006D05360|nr:ABC transporter substrate-binding protein [Methanoculleus chikugoensis]
MQTTRLILSLASLAVLLLLAGTAGATPVPPPATADGGERSVTVIDDSGKTVLIRGEPQRIVSLAPSNTEILYALGLEDRIVAVTERCDYPPATAEKPKVGGFSTVNIEKVIAMEPDLIFAAPANTDEVIDRLRSLGMTVVILDPQTIDGVLHDIELAGRATGQEEQASTLIEGLRVRIGAVAEKAAGGGPAEEPSVAHVIWHDPLWVSGRGGTFQDEVITLAGGANAFGSVDDWSIVSLEEFIITNPDYILVSSGSGMNRDATMPSTTTSSTSPACRGSTRSGTTASTSSTQMSSAAGARGSWMRLRRWRTTSIRAPPGGQVPRRQPGRSSRRGGSVR